MLTTHDPQEPAEGPTYRLMPDGNITVAGEHLTRRERERLDEERVPRTETFNDLVALMTRITDAQQARLERDLRVIAEEAPPIPGAMPERGAMRTRRGSLRPVPTNAVGRGLAPVLDENARVLHDSTREPTPITEMTADDRIAWLEEKLKEAGEIVKRRDAELSLIRQRVRELFSKRWMPSASAVLEAVHPYPEDVPDRLPRPLGVEGDGR